MSIDGEGGVRSPAQLDREIEDRDLADFARGKFKYDAFKRARLAYLVEGILRDRGVSTSGADHAALVALARAELARGAAPAPSRSHAAMRAPLGRGTITDEQARTMPRFEFIAHFLTVVTRKKENREFAQGKRVRRVGARWQVVSPLGVVEYETPDADRLFDYARRGPLGWWIRKAEDFRVEAYQHAGAG